MFKINSFKNFLATIASLIIFMSPVMVMSATVTQIVPCNPSFSGGSSSSSGSNSSSASGGNLSDECGWEQLVKMGQNIIDYSVILMAILSVIGIAYAGFLYITAQGNGSQISKAHGIFTKIIWGIVFVLGAWLIVNTILKGLEYGQNGFKSFLIQIGSNIS